MNIKWTFKKLIRFICFTRNYAKVDNFDYKHTNMKNNWKEIAEDSIAIEVLFSKREYWTDKFWKTIYMSWKMINCGRMWIDILLHWYQNANFVDSIQSMPIISLLIQLKMCK